MLFLLNDTLFRIEPAELIPPLDADRFRKLTFEFVTELGRELFAEQPLLPRSHPGRAARLAALIATKSPELNAALFVAPGFFCPTERVTAQFAQIPFEMMVKLYQRQKSGELNHLTADRAVWRRLAA